MRRALVVGASGLVGYHVAKELKENGWWVSGTWKTNDPAKNPLLHAAGLDQWGQIDLAANLRAGIDQMFKAAVPDLVVMCAAFPNVSECERLVMRCHRENRMTPTVVAQAAGALRSQFVFLSSGYIFGGGKSEYTEMDLPGINCDAGNTVYGDDKHHAEVGVMGTCPHALIVRTVGVYGQDPGNKCFSSRLVGSLKAGERFGFDGSSVSNWTWAPDLARDIVELVEERRSGIVHSAGAVQDRKTFALDVVDAFNLDATLLDDAVTDTTVPRPHRCVLRTVRPGAQAIHALSNAHGLLDLEVK